MNEMGKYGPSQSSGFIALFLSALFFQMFAPCYGESTVCHWTMIKQSRCSAMEYGVHLKITGFVGMYKISRG